MGHEPQIQKQFETRLRDTLRELLENKHLYQSVTFDSSGFKKSTISEVAQRLAESGEYPVASWNQALVNAFGSLERTLWEFDSAEEKIEALLRAMNEKVSLVRIPLPTIKIFCNHCDAIRPPHNPGYIGKSTQRNSQVLQQDSEVVQLFEATFQCQSCKGEPIVFLIHRKGLKLTLVGRSQFPEVLVPDFIPRNQRRFYSNSVIAERTNFTLAAALYLRTVVEQYFHEVIPKPEIKTIKGKPTGDELAEMYAKTLPKNFPDHFPSLKKAYSNLSEIIHLGKEDEDARISFKATLVAVDGHFKAIQLFKEISA